MSGAGRGSVLDGAGQNRIAVVVVVGQGSCDSLKIAEGVGVALRWPVLCLNDIVRVVDQVNACQKDSGSVSRQTALPWGKVAENSLLLMVQTQLRLGLSVVVHVEQLGENFARMAEHLADQNAARLATIYCGKQPSDLQNGEMPRGTLVESRQCDSKGFGSTEAAQKSNVGFSTTDAMPVDTWHQQLFLQMALDEGRGRVEGSLTPKPEVADCVDRILRFLGI